MVAVANRLAMVRHSYLSHRIPLLTLDDFSDEYCSRARRCRSMSSKAVRRQHTAFVDSSPNPTRDIIACARSQIDAKSTNTLAVQAICAATRDSLPSLQSTCRLATISTSRSFRMRLRSALSTGAAARRMILLMSRGRLPASKPGRSLSVLISFHFETSELSLDPSSYRFGKFTFPSDPPLGPAQVHDLAAELSSKRTFTPQCVLT